MTQESWSAIFTLPAEMTPPMFPNTPPSSWRNLSENRVDGVSPRFSQSCRSGADNVESIKVNCEERSLCPISSSLATSSIKLSAATEPCWLRDDQGNVVGYFRPAKSPQHPVYAEGQIPELTE